MIRLGNKRCPECGSSLRPDCLYAGKISKDGTKRSIDHHCGCGHIQMVGSEKIKVEK